MNGRNAVYFFRAAFRATPRFLLLRGAGWHFGQK
jgi:hypothetical protein